MIVKRVKSIRNNKIQLYSCIFFLKLIIFSLFSSDFQDKLFIPFVEHFLSHFNNPWQYFTLNPSGAEFPYPPLMLYIESLFYAPFHYFGLKSIILKNFFFKLPIVLADFSVFYFLVKKFPKKLKKIAIVYVFSPIAFYAAYMHSQLDLIPMALLFVSVYFLSKEKNILSAIFLGLATSTKIHILIAIPLLFIYLYKKYPKKPLLLLKYFSIPIGIFLAISFPFLFSRGFFESIFFNSKQMLIYDVYFSMGSLKLYLVLFAVAVIYARFFLYKKINQDLLYSFMALAFSVFLFFIEPSPAWYLWVVPFLSWFYLKNTNHYKELMYLYVFLIASYLIYFILFYVQPIADLKLLGTVIDLKIEDQKAKNIAFTILEFGLFATIFSFYRFGVKSNQVYKKTHNYVIGIGGDSGVGKSTLLTAIKDIFGKKLLDLEGDGDHKWERGNENWNNYTHLDPKANFLHRQADCISLLKEGKIAYRSDYDHKDGTFTPLKQIIPKEFILLAGLHPFYLPKMRKIIDLKIYLAPDENLRRHWKIIRDTSKRGYSKEKILEQIEKRMPDAEKYIYPQEKFADMVVSYFVDRKLDVGNPGENHEIQLKILLDSNIHLEPLFDTLHRKRIAFEWDYSDDMKNQIIIFRSESKIENLKCIAPIIIDNFEELDLDSIKWVDGYLGILQLFSLICLSQKMKES